MNWTTLEWTCPLGRSDPIPKFYQLILTSDQCMHVLLCAIALAHEVGQWIRVAAAPRSQMFYASRRTDANISVGFDYFWTQPAPTIEIIYAVSTNNVKRIPWAYGYQAKPGV
jgi:hypothetical protein